MMKYTLRYSAALFFVFGICLSPRAEELKCRSYSIIELLFNGNESGIFVMEVMPKPEDMLALSNLIFNMDGSRLDAMAPKIYI